MYGYVQQSEESYDQIRLVCSTSSPLAPAICPFLITDQVNNFNKRHPSTLSDTFVYKCVPTCLCKYEFGYQFNAIHFSHVPEENLNLRGLPHPLNYWYMHWKNNAALKRSSDLYCLPLNPFGWLSGKYIIVRQMRLVKYCHQAGVL